MWRALEDEDGVDSLLSFVPLVSPTYRAPEHLRPLAEAFHRADRGEQVFLVSSTPPRHGKTESILHWAARHILRHPHETVAYVSYSASLAHSKSRKCRDLAIRAGVQLSATSKSAAEWRTSAGGGMIATGVGGPITGMGVNVLIVDDPCKNREEAESEVYRTKVHEWFTSTALTRLDPGAPPRVIVNMARWHDDDLVGRLRDDSEIQWEVMNLQAIDDETGRELWPEKWPLEALEQRQKMVGQYDWASLYQGRPMPRDGYCFKEPTRYRIGDLAHLAGARLAIGVDPAATAKTSADHSAIVVLAARGSGKDQIVDVVDVWRGQVETPALVAKLASIQERWGAPAFVEAVAGFKAVPQMMRHIHPGLRVVDVNPVGDKFVRSLALKAAWNEGRVRIPMPGTMFPSGGSVDVLTREITKFTGKGDKQDDQVDALAHAFTAIDQRMPAARRGVQVLQGGLA